MKTKHELPADRIHEIVSTELNAADISTFEEARRTKLLVSAEIYNAAMSHRRFQVWCGGVLQPYLRIAGYDCQISLGLKGERCQVLTPKAP